MMYSVWDHASRTYHYYQTPKRNGATSAPKPAHLRSARHSKLGVAPERAAWPLPAGAKKVGSGKYPKGMIAGTHSGLGILPVDLTPANVVVLGALGYLFVKHVWNKR